MQFNDLVQPFTDSEKEASFLLLQSYLLECNNKDKHFFVGRLSGNEPNLCGKLIRKRVIPDHLKHEMLTTAGIQFTKNSDYTDYLKAYTTSCKNCDLLGIWSSGMYVQTKDFYTFLDRLVPKKKNLCSSIGTILFYGIRQI